MKKIALFLFVIELILTGCSRDKTPEKVFQPVPPNRNTLLSLNFKRQIRSWGMRLFRVAK